MATARGRQLGVLAFFCAACSQSVLPQEDLFEEARFIDDVAGDDQANGMTPETAWRSLDRVNRFIPRTSTRISFKRGGTWRGSLDLHGGTVSRGWVAYGASGAPDAPKPRILTSVDIGEGWRATAVANVWEHVWEEDANLPSGDVVQGPGNLYFLDAQGVVLGWGWRKQSRPQLVRDGDFFYSPSERRIELFSSAKPGGRIEAAINRNGGQYSGQSFLIVEDLDLRFGGAMGLRGHEAKHLRFRRLDVSWYGGGTKRGEYVRLGNGVELEGSIEDAIVEEGRFFQIYDTGVDSQKVGTTAFTQRDISFRRNVISRTGLACFEFWGRGASGSKFERVSFTNNTCLFSGSGWGFEQHDHVGQGQIGADVLIFENSASVSNFVVTENIFHGARVGVFAEYAEKKTATRALVDGATFDWNLYSRPSQWVALLYDGDDPGLLPTSRKFATLAEWGTGTGKEPHGIEGDPGFVALDGGDPFSDDLRLRPDSPALRAGSLGGPVGALGP